MTSAERRRLDRFFKHVNRKLDSIEANFRFMRSLHKFEINQLKAKIRRLPRRTRAAKAGAR